MRFQEIYERCWTGYRQAGMKKKGDRQVPNCVPVEEVKTGPEMTLNDLLYTAAAKAIHQAGLEGIPMDYEEAIKKAAKIYRIPYTPSELPRLLAQRDEIDRKLAMLKQGKQVAKARRQAKLAPTPAGSEEWFKTHSPVADRIKPPTRTLEETEADLAEDLKKWFKEKWVRFGPDGKIRGDCARGSSSEGKPKCLPQAKAHALGKKGRASAAAKKRREDPNPERRGPARNVATKVQETTAMQDPNFAAGMAAKKAGGGSTDIMLAQPDIAKNQQYLDKIAAAYGLPAGLSAEQIKAKYQAASQQRAIDDIARKQGLPAGMTKDQLMQAWRKKVQGQTQAVAEGAQDDSERHHGWRAELVDEITPTTFEVQLTNRRNRETANFVVRPVDMIRPGLAGKFSIDSMDLKDLQTGATRSIQSDSDEPWVYILDAVSALFWDTPALQQKLQAQLKAHQDQGLSMLPGLNQRRSAGQGMPVKDFVQGQQAAKDAISKAQGKKGMAEGFEYGNRVQHPKYGAGQVIRVYPNGMITVNFPNYPDPIDKKPGVQSNFAPGDSGYQSLKSIAKEQYTDDDDWYDEQDDRLKDGDYVRDRQDGEYGEIFRMSGDPTERRVRILDRDGKGWYISPERLDPVDPTDPDIQRYFGKHRQRDMDEGWSDAVVARRTGRPRTPYSVYIKGRKWKDFENDDHAEAVANKLRAKFKADGRDPSVITIAPTDISEAVTLDRDRVPDYPRDSATVKHRTDTAKAILSDPRSDPDSRREASAILASIKKIDEKQDACYRKVKSRYKVWPSAYASGALVQCRKKGAANWGNKSKK